MILNTTLGYIEKDDHYLMMHRIKKKNDINQDKWIGIGGKMEESETPWECMKRECLEETGLIWKDPELRGIVTFNYDAGADQHDVHEIMYLFTGNDFEGEAGECNEGVLEWVSKNDIQKLPLWAGDLLFFDLLKKEKDLFDLRLDYEKNDLKKAWINGKPVDLEEFFKSHPCK